MKVAVLLEYPQIDMKLYGAWLPGKPGLPIIYVHNSNDHIKTAKKWCVDNGVPLIGMNSVGGAYARMISLGFIRAVFESGGTMSLTGSLEGFEYAIPYLIKTVRLHPTVTKITIDKITTDDVHHTIASCKSGTFNIKEQGGITALLTFLQ